MLCYNDITAMDAIVGSIPVKLTKSGGGGSSPESSGGLTLYLETIVSVSVFLYLSICLSVCLSVCLIAIRPFRTQRSAIRMTGTGARYSRVMKKFVTLSG